MFFERSRAAGCRPVFCYFFPATVMSPPAPFLTIVSTIVAFFIGHPHSQVRDDRIVAFLRSW